MRIKYEYVKPDMHVIIIAYEGGGGGEKEEKVFNWLKMSFFLFKFIECLSH